MSMTVENTETVLSDFERSIQTEIDAWFMKSDVKKNVTNYTEIVKAYWKEVYGISYK